MALKDIKLKIQSVKKTSTVTRAMEAVSAVKMRKAQERALGGRAYAAAALTIMQKLAGSREIKTHPLAQERAGKTAIVIITSDKGLAGALNSAVIRKTEQEIRDRGLVTNDLEIFAMGKRGGEYFRSRGYSVTMRTNIDDGIGEREVLDLTKNILSMPEITKVFVVYQNFISTFEQKPVIRQILPIRPETMQEIVAGIVPAKGKYAGVAHTDTKGAATYAIEPSVEVVVNELMPRLLNIAVFHALLEAKASEHSARMVAMKGATDKAKEIATLLTRKFNKVRQAAITREVSEITSGIEAMK